MNGATLNRVISTPLKAPTNNPRHRTRMMIAGIFKKIATPSGGIGTPRLISKPEVIAASPTVEPTDRSMPPVRMTNVIPIAMIALIAVWPTRMIRFSRVKNEGERIEKMKIRTPNAINALSRKRNTPSDKPEDLGRVEVAADVGIG